MYVQELELLPCAWHAIDAKPSSLIWLLLLLGLKENDGADAIASR